MPGSRKRLGQDDGAVTARRGRPALDRQALSWAMAQIDASDGRSLRVSEICADAGVSQRTMRSAFQSTLGMSPSRYIRMRRLHLVRAALFSAMSGHTTIATIGQRFGFRDPGRMAAEYHALFGEYPHETLRRGEHAARCG
ncbi:helix-turn-helix transcriptional regulator [Lysobacter sp. MMG2]|uniref:helix-turn-helix transcriptional regulator n=1 Tax=Lysobacter sp. MMG2 TaxID=2801338 RepID=UPI001C21C19D|nr:helix-turn-helix transcriptional regulator [Lysobacter sp. MMG2]MBU8976060.1 helix-turn-helix transcriptional regulator [Lysobacter sp. MMG2]